MGAGATRAEKSRAQKSQCTAGNLSFISPPQARDRSRGGHFPTQFSPALPQGGGFRGKKWEQERPERKNRAHKNHSAQRGTCHLFRHLRLEIVAEVDTFPLNFHLLFRREGVSGGKNGSRSDQSGKIARTKITVHSGEPVIYFATSG